MSKPADAAKAYGTATASLNTFLESVELPLADDARYSNPSEACFYKCDAGPSGAGSA